MTRRLNPPIDEFLALDGVTLQSDARRVFPRTRWVFESTQQWAVLGPNGSGKSCLARALVGEVPAVRGEIRWGFAGDDAPEDCVELVSSRTHRDVSLRQSSFYQSRWHSGIQEGELTTGQFLAPESVQGVNPFAVERWSGNRTQFFARRRSAVALFRLVPLLRRRLACLSNGEMRKVLLARALIRGPRLLVLDEPFAGLDRGTRQHLRAAINRLMRGGLRILVLTSQPEEIPSGVTHWLLVNQHRVVAQGPRSALQCHQLVRRLQSAVAPARRVAIGPRRAAGNRHRAAIRHSPFILELRRVSVRYGAKCILREITWRVRRGECWAVVGPNGSGKTTLLNLIQGDHPQGYSQDIRLFGADAQSTQTIWQARRRLGWLSPELQLHYPPGWTCLEVVASGFAGSIGMHETVSRRRRLLARQWLARLGLSRHSTDPLGHLPSGDQRMVFLARALVRRPELVVLDEPCQGLDARHRGLLLEVVDEFVQFNRASLIFVTHHPHELPRCVTHTLKLRHGRIIGGGGPTA